MTTMTAAEPKTFRDLVVAYARRRGWTTQRHIAVACEIDETALSRFLGGEQEIGSVRTYALLRTVGVPVERCDAAFLLLDRAQREAQARRDVRQRAVRRTGRPPLRAARAA